LKKQNRPKTLTESFELLTRSGSRESQQRAPFATLRRSAHDKETTMKAQTKTRKMLIGALLAAGVATVGAAGVLASSGYSRHEAPGPGSHQRPGGPDAQNGRKQTDMGATPGGISRGSAAGDHVKAALEALVADGALSAGMADKVAEVFAEHRDREHTGDRHQGPGDHRRLHGEVLPRW
jgi:hypothetical protein